MKTLKAKRSIKHTELLTDVIALVRFPLEIPALLARIEVLISQNYMRRDNPEEKESKPNTLYHYIA